MGAYLSTPVTDKKSHDLKENDKYTSGLSGMQGWRISMEDAHNCVPQMDKDTGFFAVYDGHGGGEVAIYCSHHFIDVLKDTEEYQEGKIDEALKTTFLKMDEKLRDPLVVKELKLLSQMEPGDPPVTEQDIKKMEEEEKQEREEVEDETKLLYEEATMSIEELLAKYGRVVNETEQKLKSVINKEESGSTKSSNSTKNSDGEAVGTDNGKDSQDESKTESSKATGDNKKETTETKTEDGKVNEAGDEGVVVKKKLQKEFLKVKPTKINDEDDSEDDHDYEGFESDEAVEGSSSDDDDDDDDVSDDADEEEEEEGTEEEGANEGWSDEKAEMFTGPRGGVEEPGVDSGSTAVVALLRDIDLYVANAGDSRCVLSRKNGVAFDMSDDHKPEDELELSRITAAGGHVNVQGRVNGGLNLSRAIGDHLYKTNPDFPLEKQMITALPDVRHVTLEPGDEFIVIACDGIWNVLNSQEVVDFVRERLSESENATDNGTEQSKTSEKIKLSKICEELFQKCLAPDTSGDGTGCDNMTCIIVKFEQDWLTRRHSARKAEVSFHREDIPSGKKEIATENSKDIENSINAKGDSLNKLESQIDIESSKYIVDSNKRPLVTSDQHDSCINGDSGPVKRIKLDQSST